MARTALCIFTVFSSLLASPNRECWGATQFLIANCETGLKLVAHRDTAHLNFGNLTIYQVNGNGVPDQRWLLDSVGNGEYLIKNAETGLSIVPIRETRHRNFGKLVLYQVSGSGSRDQRWTIENTGDMWLIRNADSRLAIVPVPETARFGFGQLILFDVSGGAEQQHMWQFIRATRTNQLSPRQDPANHKDPSFRPLQTGNEVEVILQSLDGGLRIVPMRETVHLNFGELVLYGFGDNGVRDQRWKLVHIGDDEYLIQNAESGLSIVPIRATANRNYGDVVLFKVVGKGASDHRWRLVETSNGIVIRNAKTGLALVPVSETAHLDFCKLMLWDAKGNGAKHQTWVIVPEYSTVARLEQELGRPQRLRPILSVPQRRTVKDPGLRVPD